MQIKHLVIGSLIGVSAFGYLLNRLPKSASGLIVSERAKWQGRPASTAKERLAGKTAKEVRLRAGDKLTPQKIS